MSVEPTTDWIEPEVLISEQERRGEPLPPLVEIVCGGPITPLPPLPEKFHPAPRPKAKLKSSLRQLREKIGAAGAVDVKAGVSLLKQVMQAGFDETVSLHIHLGIDPTQPKPVARGTVSLPHGVGADRQEVKYRADRGGWVHVGVGKMSFPEDKLVDNINALLDAVRATKPSEVKDNYIDSVVLSTAASPGIPVTI